MYLIIEMHVKHQFAATGIDFLGGDIFFPISVVGSRLHNFVFGCLM